ncbi:MAG: serpin family protein [Candidatus Woesebacteria bacterium]|jgi:serpin B
MSEENTVFNAKQQPVAKQSQLPPTMSAVNDNVDQTFPVADPSPPTQPPPQASDLKAKINQQNDQQPTVFKLISIVALLAVLAILCFAAWNVYQDWKSKQVDKSVAIPPVLPTPKEVTYDKKQYQETRDLPLAFNSFGLNLFKVLTLKQDQNVFISPSSIALVLSMLNNGANNQTQDEIAEGLNIKGMDLTQLNQGSAKLIAFIQNADPEIKINLANAVWAQQGADFKAEFLEANRQYYGAKAENLDFAGPNAVKTIDAWRKESLGAENASQLEVQAATDTQVYVANLVAFKGLWTYGFDKKLNQEKDFTAVDGSSQKIPFMNQYREDFMYLDSSAFQAVALPLGKNKNLNLYIFLPKNTLEDFLSELNQSNLDTWLENFAKTEGSFSLPKFNISYQTELKEALETLGLKLAFSSKADFKKLTDKKLALTNVMHQSLIEIDEAGADNTAVTDAEMEQVLGASTKEFKTDQAFELEVNKAFVFLILNKDNNDILFIGAVKQLNNSN